MFPCVSSIASGLRRMLELINEPATTERHHWHIVLGVSLKKPRSLTSSLPVFTTSVFTKTNKPKGSTQNRPPPRVRGSV